MLVSASKIKAFHKWFYLNKTLYFILLKNVLHVMLQTEVVFLF